MVFSRFRGGRRRPTWPALGLVLIVAALTAMTSTAARANPLSGRGMWIWYVADSNGGDVGSIISTSHRYGISVLMVKAGDGTGAWGQFNSGFVSQLHSAGIRACAWQYVYGYNPVGEAEVGAQAVHNGADCLLIDAESEYEGNYVGAQTYIRKLRQLIGGRFPVALASFPYVFDHPAFPYSVFMGPGGAQYNAPQMYWTLIGQSVDSVYANTFVWNRPYGRAIGPLGDIAYGDGPPQSSDIRRFRSDSHPYGAIGVSWWDWQEAPGYAWQAISQRVGPPHSFSPASGMPTLRRGDQSDVVVWAQEHLYSAGYRITVDGNFGAHTQATVQAFQRSHGLRPASGAIGNRTWRALLRYAPARVTWTSGGAQVRAVGALTFQVPKNAHLPAKRDEIPKDLGAH